MKYILSALVVLVITGGAFSQNADWIEQMQDPSVNFYTVQQSFEEYWKNREIEKGKGWKQFKRWEAFMEPRVYPEGVRPNPSVLVTAYEKFKKENPSLGNSGNWEPIGPFEGNMLGGIGRVNRLAFHPSNSQIIWAGTPAGGLWKSVDGGQNWTTNTDMFTNLGISDIEIDPSDPSVMYIATGDRDGGDTYSYGVLKSTDGGQSWQTTGLSWEINLQVKVFDLYIHPVQTDTLLALTSYGIYRSTDGGNQWTQTESGVFNSFAQKPGDPNTLYATSMYVNNCDVYKSTDNGISWSQLGGGLPANGVRRMELAVTPDDPEYVYVLCGANNNGYHGLYRSTNSGSSWSLRSNQPNLMGWSSSGADQGGQAWYDLAIAVDPNDKERLYVGGVNVWGTQDGGQTWQIAGHWTGDNAPYIHADIHHLIFTEDGSALFAGCDGGVYRGDGSISSWVSLNDGMNITQYYKLGASASDTTLIIAGAQDNGTDLKDGTSWQNARGGDGMECAIDPQDPNIMYSSVYYGRFLKSEDRGQSFFANFNLPPSGSGNWVTPFLLDPKHPDTIYTGFSRIWRSFDGGQSFSATGPSMSNNNIDQLGIAPGHTHVLYFSEGNDLYRSDDHGSTFINLSSSVPGSAFISSIAVSYADPMHVLITRSGYNTGQKVFESTDGGLTWKNISYNLPGVPANCAVFENAPENRIYVGTDLGVYYIDDNFTEWQPFNVGLPNVIVNELEINYQNRKIRAATYGRGLWESPLYSDISAPLAGISLPSSICLNDVVTINDASFYNPDEWLWEISPSSGYTFVNGTSKFSENPQLTFTQPGIYNIELTSSNAYGSDSSLVISAIAPGGFPLPLSEDFEEDLSPQRWSAEEDWSVYSSSGNRSLFVNLYNGNPAEKHEIVSPPVSFVDHDSVKLSFDYAYSGTPLNEGDSLKIFISSNCSGNWSLLASFGENGSGNFRTSPAESSEFTPSSAEWCSNCPEIDLSSYAGHESVRLKFQVISNGGNNIYLDNIMLSGKPNTAPVAAFSSLTEDLCALSPVQFNDQSFGSPTTYEWTFYGGTPAVSNLKNPQVSFPSQGTYDVKLKVSNAMGSDSILKTAYVNIVQANPVQLDLFPENTTLCYYDTLRISSSAVNAGANPIYRWYINNSLVQEGSNPEFQMTSLRTNSEVYATVESSEKCAWPAILSSDTLDIQVYPFTDLQLTEHSRVCISDTAITLSANYSGGTFSGTGVMNNTFDPSVAGEGVHIITYDYTDPNGCNYTKQQMIRVDRPTTISFQGNREFCLNDGPQTLNIGRPFGGSYSGTGVFDDRFYPDSTGLGDHMVYYTYDLGGCGSFTDSVEISVISGPQKPVISYQAPELVCDQTANSYQWFRNGFTVLGATGQTYQPSSNGTYTVRITDGDCSSTSDPFSYNIGLEESPNAKIFELFPNPAEEYFTIHLETDKPASGILYLYNNVGQLISAEPLENSTKIERRIDVHTLPSGIYLLHIKGEDLNISRRITIR